MRFPEGTDQGGKVGLLQHNKGPCVEGAGCSPAEQPHEEVPLPRFPVVPPWPILGTVLVWQLQKNVQSRRLMPTEKLYEEVEPVAILDSRTKQPEVADKEQEAAEKQRSAAQLEEFLVKWPDQEEPEWVSTVLIVCIAGAPQTLELPVRTAAHAYMTS